MSPERLLQLQTAYIQHIMNFLDGEDPNAGLLRTFLDNWFAYYMGGDFLTPTGRARWFNRGDLAKKPEAVEKFHFHSVKSRDVYKAEGRLTSEPLVKDHALPVAVLITSEEHQQLSDAGLGFQMPEGANGDVAKRYEAVGIVLVKPSA